MKHGIVLFAHGSRDPLWHAPIEAVAAQIRASDPHTAVVCAYLEWSQPDLAGALRTLQDLAVEQVQVVPMFLGVGKHAREDLPQLVADLRQQFARMSIRLSPAVSEDPRCIQALAQIALNPA